MRAHKVDRNQRDIVAALRGVGATVHVTSGMGKGFPDLVVGFRGVNHLVEVKPDKKAQLTEDEIEFLDRWRGEVHVITSVEEALRMIGVVP